MKHKTWMIALICLAVNLGWKNEAPSQETLERVETHRERVAVSVTPAGMRHHVPGRWATMSVNGINNSDEDSEELVVVHLGADEHRQFARRFWIPAGARRQTWLPVAVPKVDLNEQPRIDMTSIQLKESSEGESFQANVVGQAISNRSLLLSRPGGLTAMILNPPDGNLQARSSTFNFVYAIHAFRDSSRLALDTSELVNYSAKFLPPNKQALDTLDHLVIVGDEFLRDSTAATRIMQWLRDGGRLWIMIDQMKPESLDQLLGDANCFAELDRVELNEFNIDQINDNTGESIASNEWSSDSPVELVRGIADADQMLCRIEGWPAVFFKAVGNGEILFTTVNIGALIEDEGPVTSFRAATSNFFSPRSPVIRTADVMTSLVDHEIGYRIPRRGTIAAVLGLQLLLVLGAGVWLWKQRRLDRLALVIPVSAAAATLFLVWMGRQNVGSVDPTFAVGQIVRVNATGSEAWVDSMAAVYSDTSGSLELSASPQTTMSLDDKVTSRLLWTDDGKSQWMHLAQPPGVVRHVSSDSQVRLSNPWTFKGQFTDRGFEGHLNGIKTSQSQDALVVSSSSPSLALANENGTWVGTPANVLLTGQFASQSLL
ncbi:MAG: hypothetical protein WBD20_25660, partial [Pirellulaceae bacterium]